MKELVNTDFKIKLNKVDLKYILLPIVLYGVNTSYIYICDVKRKKKQKQNKNKKQVETCKYRFYDTATQSG